MAIVAPTEELLTRGVADVIERKSLEAKLRSGRPLRIKHGVDPTSPNLHLGHATIYRKLRAFQDLGHTVIFLIGDFTARFGDPTDKSSTRSLRTADEVEAAAQTYLTQVGLLLDMGKNIEVRRNSEWYNEMPLNTLLTLMSHFTVQRMLERDMFAERMKKGIEIRLQEPVYPVLQAYDSVILKADVTVVGSDQTFNELQARELQRDFNRAPQDVMILPILRGLDGKRKMSQSLGNTIGLAESSHDMFGKVMSIPDTLIGEYFRLCTDVPEAEIKEMLRAMRKKELNPREAKAKLAEAIVTFYHGGAAARAASEEFTAVFQKKVTPTEIPEITIRGAEHKLLDVLVSQQMVSSRSEGRRLMEQGGVRLANTQITDWGGVFHIRDKDVLQIGPRRFYRLRISE